jgi:hypothetical protein
VGKVAKDTLEMGTDLLNTTVQLKALGAKKLLLKGVKSAAKASMKTLADQARERKGLLEEKSSKE